MCRLPLPALCSIPPPAPCVTWSGPVSGLQVHIAWNGRCATHGVDQVGTTAAALTTYLAVQAFKPDVVISAGTAGGFNAQVRTCGCMVHDTPTRGGCASTTPRVGVATMGAPVAVRTSTCGCLPLFMQQSHPVCPSR